MNLLKETMEKLKENNKSFDDVIWIGCKDFKISKENFLKCADVWYDNGFGGNEVPEDLIIVGADFWLERNSYDGAEWWEYKSPPKAPSQTKTVETLVRNNKTEERRWASNDLLPNNGIKYMVVDYD